MSLVSPLYEMSWRKLIYSYTDADGKLIPREQRTELMDYLTKGIIPKGFMLGILLQDFHKTFKGEITPLARRRLAVIVDFCFEYLPSHWWGTIQNINKYSEWVSSGRMREQQAEYVKSHMETVHNDIFID